MVVCVYAAASDKINKSYINEVENLGEKLAKNQHKLIYGGGSTGLMGAIARGFRKQNGNVVGVVPKFMHSFEPVFDDCTELIETETMGDRKQIMEDNTDVFIIVPGGIGTFDELFQCLTLRALDRHSKKIILFNIEDYYTPLIEYMNKCTELGFINPNVKNQYTIANTAEDILELLS